MRAKVKKVRKRFPFVAIRSAMERQAKSALKKRRPARCS